MMIMHVEEAFCKAHAQLEELVKFVRDCSENGVRIDQVERGIHEGLLHVGFTLLEEFVAEAGDGDAGQSIEIEGEKLQRYPEQHSKPYRSIFGKLEITRYVYGIREGQKIQWVPLDARLGLPAEEQSYVLEDWLDRLCVKEAFREGVQSLRDLLGIKTSVRAAEVMNRRMARYAEGFWQAQPGFDPEQEEEILVVTGDGKGVPMRRTLEQRLADDKAGGASIELSPPAPADNEKTRTDGSRKRKRDKKRTRKQMAYIGAVYSVARYDRAAEDIFDEVHRRERRNDRPRPQNKRVWGEMTDICEGVLQEGRPRLFISLALELLERDPEGQRPLVCLMDGEKALWAEQQTWFGRAVPILDIYHVLERLWDVAHCFHAKKSAPAEHFVDHHLRLLLEGKVSAVCGRFRRLAREKKLRGKKKTTVLSVIGYFQNNRERMRYDQYLAAGYPIGSGVVEGSCRHVVNDRLEQTGMRWEIEGAKAMVQTRCIYLNGEWDAFVEYRIKTEQSALYRQAA